METDPTGASPLDGPELALLRHDRLRRTAPAVQHEVNNALMVLASNLELLGRVATEGAPRRQLDRAIEATRRLDETVRGFLDAARRDPSDEAAIPLQAALRPVLPLMRVALGARSGFDFEAEEGGWTARLDRALLDLALLSLAREAAGRMAPGARIAARAENRPEAGEVALRLSLPAGAEPAEETLRLLHGAACATGGRLERSEGGFDLLWPRAKA